MKRTVAVWMMALALAGCASGGKEYKSGADLAKAAGCSGYQKDDEPPMFTQESGKCQIDGKDVYVAIYADKDARDNADKMAKAAGAPGYFGEGENWGLQSFDKAAVEKGTKAAGGDMTT